MTQDKMPLPNVTWQNRAAQHRHAVFLCADDNYVPYSLFLANQIAAAHPNRDFDICIVGAGQFTPHPLYEALNIRLVQIDTAELETLVKAPNRIGFSAFLRIFMPGIWQGEYDRLFYLDGDIFYQRGDISALLKAPMAGKALAAVTDCRYWGRRDHYAEDIRALGVPNGLYFNSGVLLIDVPRFVGGGYSDKVLSLIYARGKDLGAADQTALNVAMSQDWAELPVQWNYQYHYTTMLWSAYFDACLFHFVGTRKPFYSGYGASSRRFTTPYRLFFQQHFPHLAAQVVDGLGGPAKWSTLVLVWLHNMRKLRGILMLEAQADGDLDIQAIAPKDLN